MHAPHARDRVYGRRRGLGEQRWATATLRDLEQQLRRLIGEAAGIEALLQVHEVAPHERPQQLVANGLAHLEAAHERRIQGGVA